MFTFIDCSKTWRSQPDLAWLWQGYLCSKQPKMLDDDFGPTGGIAEKIPVRLTALYCTDIWIWINLDMLKWKQLCLSLGSSLRKKKRFILTLNSIFGKEKTLVHTKLWFQVTWTKEDESYKMRRLSWRTQQGCIWWELRSSPMLQKSLVVALFVWVMHGRAGRVAASAIAPFVWCN